MQAHQKKLIQVKLKTGKQSNISNQYKQLVKKSKLGLECSEWNNLVDDLQQKRDAYCELGGDSLKDKTLEDGEQTRQIEAKVMYFLKSSLMVNRLLDLNELANTPALDIQWNNTFTTNSNNRIIQVTTSNQEVCNVLYEFTVIKLKIGESLLFGPERDESEKKDGLQKLRNALWSIQMMRMKGRSEKDCNDLDSGFWSVMELYLVVLCYAGLYTIHGGLNKMTYGQREIVAGLAAAACQGTNSVLEQLDKVQQQNQQQQQWCQEVQNNCRLLCAYFDIQSHYSMSLYHEEMVESQPTQGHFGLAMAYSLKTQALVQRHVEQFKQSALPIVQSSCITSICTTIQDRLANMTKRNNQIYKDKVPSQQDLECFDLQLHDQMKIEPKMPGLFADLVHPGVEKVMGQQVAEHYLKCDQFYQTQIDNIKQGYQHLRELQTEQYLQGKITYLLNVQGGQQDKQNCLKQKVQQFTVRSQSQDLIEQMHSLHKLATISSQMINAQSQQLDGELKHDYDLKQHYKDHWNRMSSQVSQKEYRAYIQQLADKYRVAQSVDQPMLAKFNQAQSVYLQIKKDPSILTFTHTNQIKTQFQPSLNQIATEDKEIKKEMEKIEQMLKQVIDYQHQHSLYQQLGPLLSKHKDTSTLTSILFKDLKGQVEMFNQQTQKVCEQVLNLKALGESLYLDIQKVQADTNKFHQDQKLIDHLQTFLDIYTQVDQGINFYQKLIEALTKNQQVIQDYCMARQQEEFNLTALISNKQNFYKKKKK